MPEHDFDGPSHDPEALFDPEARMLPPQDAPSRIDNPKKEEPKRDDKPAADGDKPRKKRRRRGGRKNEYSGGSATEGSGDAAGTSEGSSKGPRPTKPTDHEDDHIEETDEGPFEESEVFAGCSFASLGLRGSVMKGCRNLGYRQPTHIQAQLIPPVLSGRDVLGQAKTGTGKTAAFGLPMLHSAERNLEFQGLVLCPTRELAIQITAEIEELAAFTPIRVVAVYGGQPIPKQVAKLEKGPEIIVATPGRLMDLHQHRHLHFRNMRQVVLDEVDRMLDIGFRDDIKKILGGVQGEHQTVFVSATLGDEIESLARTFMNDPLKIVTSAGSLTVNTVEQFYVSANRWDKKRMLLHSLTHEDPDLTIVFCRTKRMVDDLAKYLRDKNVEAHSIHGDMPQTKRNAVMRKLHSGHLSVLVASDLAARGLDVQNVSHVVNFDLPEDPEIYIHRIGRTARAGKKGVAWSLVTPADGELLTNIELLADIHIHERKYDDFKPGSAPTRVREERQQKEKVVEALRANTRTSGPKLPDSKSANAAMFPGGVVPTKLPPRSMGGRVNTARAQKKLNKDIIAEQSDKKQPDNK